MSTADRQMTMPLPWFSGGGRVWCPVPRCTWKRRGWLAVRKYRRHWHRVHKPKPQPHLSIVPWIE